MKTELINTQYAISLETVTRLELTEYGKQTVAETFTGVQQNETKHFIGYECKFNPITECWQHYHYFGSKQDYKYGTDAGTTLTIRNGYVEVMTYAHGGMTGLEFTENDHTTHPKNSEDMTINYTLKLVKTLINEGIVSVPERWKNEVNA